MKPAELGRCVSARCALTAGVMLVSASAWVIAPVSAAWAGPGPSIVDTAYNAPGFHSVPANTCAIAFDVRGGQGEDARDHGGVGGAGGRVVATVRVSPGDSYLVRVGASGAQGGISGGQISGGRPGPAASMGFEGGAGGGASSVTLGNDSLPTIIAAGGGGAGGDVNYSTDGGRGGAVNGEGASASPSGNATGGGGATLVGDGTAGSSANGFDPAMPGSAGNGGRGGYVELNYGASGGGGGGGWYGGGGGGVDEAEYEHAAGGGGGSNKAPANATVNSYSDRSGSGSVEATFVRCPPPEPPTDLSGEAGDASATLTFSPKSSKYPVPITGYEVSIDDGVTWKTLDSTSGPADSRKATLSELINGTAYKVRVRAVNDTGPSLSSDSVTVIPRTTPGVPRDVTVKSLDAALAISFVVPATDGGSAITGYQYSIDGDTWHALAASGTQLVKAEITALSNGKTYQVRLRAVNLVGPGSATTAVPGTPEGAKPPVIPPVIPPVSTPGAVIGLTATAGDARATLSFTAPKDDGGSPITGYEVSTDGGSTWATLTTGAGEGGTRTGTLTSLVNGRTYDVRVRAVNAAGPASASASASVTPMAPAPTPEPAPQPTPQAPVRLNLQLQVAVNAPLVGATAQLTGGGLQASSAYTLTMNSEPIVVATGRTNSLGGFRATITMPRKACVTGGLHRLVLSGTAPDGTTVQDTSYIVLDDTCATRSVRQAKPVNNTVALGLLRFPYLAPTLTPHSRSVLRNMRGSLRTAKLITLTGYTETDRKSPAAVRANRVLATRRAAAVRTYLKLLGVKSRIKVVGAGGVRPLKGQPQKNNRRVEVTVRY